MSSVLVKCTPILREEPWYITAVVLLPIKDKLQLWGCNMSAAVLFKRMYSIGWERQKLTLSKTRKACFSSYSVSLSFSLCEIREHEQSATPWFSTYLNHHLHKLLEIHGTRAVPISLLNSISSWLIAARATSIMSSSSSWGGLTPIDLITAPSSLVDTVPSPSWKVKTVFTIWTIYAFKLIITRDGFPSMLSLPCHTFGTCSWTH